MNSSGALIVVSCDFHALPSRFSRLRSLAASLHTQILALTPLLVKPVHHTSKNLTFLPSPPLSRVPIAPIPSSRSLLLRRSLLFCLASLASRSFQSLTCRFLRSDLAWAIAGVCTVIVSEDDLSKSISLPLARTEDTAPNRATFSDVYSEFGKDKYSQARIQPH